MMPSYGAWFSAETLNSWALGAFILRLTRVAQPYDRSCHNKIIAASLAQ
jgi:hypothetical protein